MKHRKFVALAALTVCTLPLLSTAVTPALAQETAAGNVKVTFRIGTLEDGRRVVVKTYDLIVSSGSAGSKLLSGSRVPFPTSIEPAQAGKAGAMAGEIVYQNVGFSSEVMAWILDDKRVKLTARVENSQVVEGEAGMPPSVETRQLSVNAILTAGAPLELTRGEGVSDQPGFVEVVATILE